MNPLPLRDRVFGALELSAMTVDAMARILCASRSAVRIRAHELRESGVVVFQGTRRTHGRPHIVFGIAK